MPTTAIEKTTPTPAAIAILAAEESGVSPNLSIYLAAHRAGSGTIRGSVRLHSTLNRIRESLPPGPDRDDLLGPLVDLEGDPDLHGGHGDGFAIFRSPRALRVFRLPDWDGTDALFQHRHFQILPLLGHRDGHAAFHLLTLTRKRVRLFEVGMANAVEVTLNVVADFEEFLGLDESDHTQRNRVSSRAGTVNFGTGSEREKENRRFHDFCRNIDHARVEMDGGKPLPFVVAGTEHDVAIYAAACAHPLLVAGSVFASPDDGSTVAELAAKARGVVAEWVPPERKRLVEQYRKRAGSHLASAEMKEIGAAAATGRVEHLFVVAGTVSEDVNAAACDTLLHAGTVSVLSADAMPDTTTAAALLRY